MGRVNRAGKLDVNWDACSGQPLAEPLKHQANVDSAIFSPDGTRVVTVLCSDRKE